MLGEHNYETYAITNQIIKEKIPTASLEIGMYVVELDRPWLETPFLFQGFLINSEDEISQLREYCQFVFIEAKETNTSSVQTEKVSRVCRHKIYKVPVERELPVAIKSYDYAKQTVRNVLDSVRFSQELNVFEIKAAVKGCVKSVINNPNAMLWLNQIKDKDNYTAEHSLRVSVLAVALGRELGLLPKELEDLGIAAMLHDVGKIKIPDEVLNKEGSLSPEEYTLIKTHAQEGRKMLMSKSQLPPIVVDVAWSHHERVDGKGYPRGIKANKIPHFAKIVSIVDAFDAISSERCYSQSRSTLESLRILYDCKGTQFDEDLVKAFVRLIGIYPPGHVVELTDGQVGIILACEPNNKLKPKILMVRDSDKKNCRERVLDLRHDLKDKQNKTIRVKSVHQDGAFGVHLKEYKDKGLRIEVGVA
jgi:putative nucleotidyltransferase with HDIG domain